MRHPAIIPCICGLLLVAALFAAGCTLTPGGKVSPTPAPSTCGFTTCHGLDLACGTDAPQMCTMEYRIGDKCRQYASCDAGSGSCRLVTGPKFTACKTCVEQCQTAAGADGPAAFSCEEKC